VPDAIAAPAGDEAPLAPAHTDWLRNRLRISGPAARMADFRAAAAGPGVIPWQHDLERLREDWFLQLAGPQDGERAISLAGARILSQRLCDAVAVLQQRALVRMAAGDRSCPFDLHRLLPVPAPILALGPDDPQARAWLWAHWGTTRALRHVREVPAQRDERQRKRDALAVEFWSADWSPWQALRRLRRSWPELTLELRPDYAGPEDG
ncbi:transposase, partial [Roseomonas mucosa]